jgi:hypothetical protein
MPKDYVITEHDRRQADHAGWRPLAVRVGWDKTAGWVQIATVLRADFDGIRPVEGSVDEGRSIDLDHRAINKLIRLLRTARDQAYGRDE